MFDWFMDLTWKSRNSMFISSLSHYHETTSYFSNFQEWSSMNQEQDHNTGIESNWFVLNAIVKLGTNHKFLTIARWSRFIHNIAPPTWRKKEEKHNKKQLSLQNNQTKNLQIWIDSQQQIIFACAKHLGILGYTLCRVGDLASLDEHVCRHALLVHIESDWYNNYLPIQTDIRFRQTVHSR